MPLLLDPNTNTKTIWLDSDSDKPEPQRPTFRVRVMSSRQELTINDMLDQIMGSDSGREIMMVYYDIANMLVLGWANITDIEGKPIPFSHDAMVDNFTSIEIQEIGRKAIEASRTTQEEKKTSE